MSSITACTLACLAIAGCMNNVTRCDVVVIVHMVHVCDDGDRDVAGVNSVIETIRAV